MYLGEPNNEGKTDEDMTWRPYHASIAGFTLESKVMPLDVTFGVFNMERAMA